MKASDRPNVLNFPKPVSGNTPGREEFVQDEKTLRKDGDGPHNGGEPPGGGDMEKRIAKIETDQAVMSERMVLRFDAVEQRFDAVGQRFDGIDGRFDGLDKKLDKLPSQWDMAKVVFFVVGALMAAAIWGPRAVALIAASQP